MKGITNAMLTIAPINNNYYYNRNVSFRAKSQEPNIEPQTPKEYSYADLYAQMQKLEIADIVEQEVIPPEKGTEELEILPADEFGWTKLHYICSYGDLEKFKEFVKEHPNFDPNQQNQYGMSYIRMVASHNEKDYQTILNTLAANKNIDLDKTSDFGYNDLHHLCYYGKLKAVKIFADNHPDFNPYQRTKNDMSYIDVAEKHGHHNIAHYLTKYIKQKETNTSSLLRNIKTKLAGKV